MPPRNVQSLGFWSRFRTPLFEWAHGNAELLLTTNIHEPRMLRDRGHILSLSADAGMGFPALLTLPNSRPSRTVEIHDKHPAVFYRQWNAIRFAAGRAAPQRDGDCMGPIVGL
jgi:hypothetical protein